MALHVAGAVAAAKVAFPPRLIVLALLALTASLAFSGSSLAAEAASPAEPCGGGDAAGTCTGSDEGSALVQARALAVAATRQTAQAAARRRQEVCKSGTTLVNLDLAGEIVVPEGEFCIVVNVTLSGSVKAQGSVVLIGCDITGDVEVLVSTPGTKVELVHTSVTGNVKILGSSAGAGPLLVRNGSALGSVEASDIGHIRLSDSSIGVLKLIDFSLGVTMRNVSIGDDIELLGGAGQVDFWSAAIGGALTISECMECRISTDLQTNLKGGVEIKESSGSLSMLGTTAAEGAGEIVVSGLDGNVSMESMDIGGIFLEGVSGHIYLGQITAGGAAQFAKSGGSLVADGCAFGGRFESSSAFRSLALKSCSFNRSLVEIEGCAGPVLLEGNTELSVLLSNNVGLTLDGNKITNGTLSENTGPIVLRNNIFQDLQCMSNFEVPTMEGNIVQHGQCQAAP